MRLDLKNLPTDISLLHHLVCDMAVVVETRDDEIERLHRHHCISKQCSDPNKSFPKGLRSAILGE